MKETELVAKQIKINFLTFQFAPIENKIRADNI